MLDVGQAYSRASELDACAERLMDAKRTLENYRAAVGGGWESTEVGYFQNAAWNVECRLVAAAAELNEIGKSIRSTADQIRAEQEEEERRRREEEERQRREAEERAREAAERKQAELIAQLMAQEQAV